MRKSHRDSAAWVLTSCFLLPLLTMSVLWLNRPAPARTTPNVILANLQTPTTPPVQDNDGDGDELLEHWNNPLFSHEQRWQMGGMAVFFGVTGAMTLRRRTVRRRFGRGL